MNKENFAFEQMLLLLNKDATLFEFLPISLQDLFKNKVLNLGDRFDMNVPVRYSDITDAFFPEGLKKTLHQHRKRFEIEITLNL